MDNEQSKLDRLQRKLYSRKETFGASTERSEIHNEPIKAAPEWKSETEVPLRETFKSNEADKKSSFLGKFFLLSALFFIVSVGIALVVFLGGFNKISPNNVDISILGPVSVSAGDELSLSVIVKNNNAVDLDDVVLTIHYPNGTRSAANVTVPQNTDTQSIGTIPAGQSGTKTIKAVLFGEKDTVQNITVSADYKIKLSTSPHKKEKTYEIAIKSAPVIMTVNYPTEINSGHETEFDIDITSNTNSKINDFLLTADYPFGFTFKSSDPKAYSSNNVWHLGTLGALEKRHIVVIGTLDAQNNEERTFKFTAGTALPDDDRKVGVTLAAAMPSLEVKKPEIGLNAVFSGNQNLSIKYSDHAQIAINWQNNLPINLEDIKITAQMSGNMFDETRVLPGADGFYRSIDNTAYWDKNTQPKLAEARPGASGSVSIGAGALYNFDLSKLINPEIIFDITISGTRLAEGVPETITSKVQKIIKIQTEAAIDQKVLYSIGPFKNTGPIPPKVDAETTYTIVWDVTNSFNAISGGKMVATLPSYVNWKQQVSPANENITFDPNTRQVTWNMGVVPRGSGTLTMAKEAAFQVSVVPSISQLGSSIILVNAPTMTGIDDFTKVQVQATGAVLNTLLKSEPAAPPYNETVVN